MQTPSPITRSVAPSPIDASAFNHLTDAYFVCTEPHRRDRVSIILYADGRLEWAYVRQEWEVITMDELHRVFLTWELPTNVRAGLLIEFIADHLGLLERVHLGHTVAWDGRNRVGTLDDDAVAAFSEFRSALSAFADDPDHIIVPVEAALWFESVELDVAWLEEDELEAVVRDLINDGKPVLVDQTWMVVDVVEALTYAREIRADAEAWGYR